MSSVPIDVHGSPDRVKDVSSFVKALIRRLHDECVRNVSPHAEHVPLLILPEGTCCRRCDRLQGNEPRCTRFGPTKTRVVPQTREGLRHPANRGAFHRCDRGKFPGVGLPLTPPTRSPHGWGQCALDGPCKRSDT